MRVANRKKENKEGVKISGNIRDYTFIEKISQGTYGKVDLYQKDGSKYAIKTFTNKKMGVLHLTTVRELKALMRFKNSKNIINLEKIVLGEKDIYAVFPFCETSLSIKKYETMGDLIKHFKQIVEGVQEMHVQGYLHRDLKSSNIMIDANNQIKIIDFGMTRSIQPLMTSMVTTLWYRAPELLEHGSKNVYAKYSDKIDVWSIGIILLEMLLGYPPCKTNCEIEQLKIYKRDLVDINKTFYHILPSARDLLSNILQIEPEHRYGLEDILKHEFMKNIDSDQKMVYYNEKV